MMNVTLSVLGSILTDRCSTANGAMWQSVPRDYDNVERLKVHTRKLFINQILCPLQCVRIGGEMVEDVPTKPAETEVSPVGSNERIIEGELKSLSGD